MGLERASEGDFQLLLACRSDQVGPLSYTPFSRAPRRAGLLLWEERGHIPSSCWK